MQQQPILMGLLQMEQTQAAVHKVHTYTIHSNSSSSMYVQYMYSSVVLGKLLLQYTFYTSSRGKMPCSNDGKEKKGVLAELKINFKMRYTAERKSLNCELQVWWQWAVAPEVSFQKKEVPNISQKDVILKYHRCSLTKAKGGWQ